MVPDTLLSSLAPVTTAVGMLPEFTIESSTPVFSGDGRHLFHGTTTGELFGSALALLPDLNGNGTAEFVVGAPKSDWSQTSQSGAVMVLEFDPLLDAQDTTPPLAVFSGESHSPASSFGSAITVMPIDSAKVLLGVGAVNSDVSGLDQGAAYLFELEL